MSSVFIFDLDGTLFDSSDQISRAADETREKYGFKRKSKNFYFPLIGLPANLLFKDLDMSREDLDSLVKTFRINLEKEIYKNNVMYEGSVEFLHFLKLNDLKCAVATSKPTYLAKKVIENSKIYNLIDHVQGTDDFPSKPNPEVITRCLKYLNSDNGIMFGDRIEDMQAAKNAQINSIGVAQSIYTEKDLSNAGAFLTFKNFLELNLNRSKILKKIENANKIL